MDYYEARRRARALFGQAGDVEEAQGKPFPFRVGVWCKAERAPARFVIVAAAATLEEALKEARDRQT